MQDANSRKVVHAAVGILQKSDGQVLLAERPVGKPWSGYWEFPGGKVESGETPEHALSRELYEELGVHCEKVTLWETKTHDYPAHYDQAGALTEKAKRVMLYFFIVTQWREEPRGLEGQALRWQHPNALTVSPMLPANAPIIEALLARDQG